MRKFEVVKDEFIKYGVVPQKLPQRATKNSVAYDIYSPENFTIRPNQSYMLWTGIKAQFQSDEALIINVRSSMGKKNIILANTQGWIESDYYN